MAAFRARYPLPKGGRIVPVRDLAALKSAAAASRPGDVIELAAGRYEGDVEFSGRGTAAARIVVKPASGAAVVIEGASIWTFSGTFNDVRGLRFERTKSRTIVLRGVSNRVIGNEFFEAGDGQNGDSTGLIKVENDSGWQGGVLGLGWPLQDRRAEVVGNTFVRTANTVYFQDQGIVNCVFAWNTIQGPHRIEENMNASMAIKIGYGFQDEVTNTKIMFNTINAWDGAPYVIGIKSSRTTVAYNFLERGRITLRSGNDNAVVGNDLYDGELHLSGRGHLVKGNRVRNLTSISNLGPVTAYILTAKDSEPKVDGEAGRPFFYDSLTDSVIERNTFLALDPQAGGVLMALGGERPLFDRLPARNKWVENTFVLRGSNGPFITVAGSVNDLGPDFINGNTWTRNAFSCVAVCQNAEGSVRSLIGVGSSKYTTVPTVTSAWDARIGAITPDARISIDGSAGAPR